MDYETLQTNVITHLKGKLQSHTLSLSNMHLSFLTSYLVLDSALSSGYRAVVITHYL
jgi:hypothetical protein